MKQVKQILEANRATYKIQLQNFVEKQDNFELKILLIKKSKLARIFQTDVSQDFYQIGDIINKQLEGKNSYDPKVVLGCCMEILFYHFSFMIKSFFREESLEKFEENILTFREQRNNFLQILKNLMEFNPRYQTISLAEINELRIKAFETYLSFFKMISSDELLVHKFLYFVPKKEHSECIINFLRYKLSGKQTVSIDLNSKQKKAIDMEFNESK